MPRVHQKSVRSGARITQQVYEIMVQVHRENLGAHQKAAQAAGVSYNTALRAFKEGLGEGKPPIRSLISQEMVEARAQLARYKADDADTRATVAQAARDSAESRAMQARAMRFARNNSLAALAQGARMLNATQPVVTQIEAMLSAHRAASPREALSLMRSVIEYNRTAMEMAQMSDEMERRILGQPDIVVAHTEMTPDQAVITLAEGARTLERLRRRAARGDLPPGISPQILDVLPVGATEPESH